MPDRVDLLHKTVDSLYVRDLELQVKHLKELTEAKINSEVVSRILEHLKEHNRSRVMGLYMILEATHRTLTSMEISSDNVNRVAEALKKSLNTLNQEK